MNDTPDQPEIAIVGSGIGGLTLCAALARVGVRATIYEQAASITPLGAGIQLTANATKALAGLGVLNEIRAQSFEPEIGYNREGDTGAVTNELPMGKAIEAAYGAPDLALNRAVLQFALLRRVPEGALRLGYRLKGIERRGDRVRLEFEDGRSVEADAVIGADGIHSVVREILFGAERPSFTGRVAYRTTFPTARIAGEAEGRVKWWGADRHVVSYLLTPSGDEVYYIAVTPEPEFQLESWSAMGDMADLLAAFEGFHPNVLALLRAPEQVRKWALADRDPMPRWGEAGITLLGDACHPMPPFIAQGAAAAIEDAIVLARCIERFGAARADRAFAAYEAARRPRTTRMQQTARANTWMRFETDTDWVYGYDAWRAPVE